MEKYKEWIEKYPGITFLTILFLTFVIAIGLCLAPGITFFIVGVFIVAICLWGLVMLMLMDIGEW